MIDVIAESSKVVRLPSGVQALPKLAPAPFPELRSTDTLSGEMREMFKSESRVWVIPIDTATLASGPAKAETTFVDSMLPTSGMFVEVPISNRDGLRDTLPLETVSGTVNAPWDGLVRERYREMLVPHTKPGCVEIWKAVAFVLKPLAGALG